MTSSVVVIFACSAGLRYVTPPTSRPRFSRSVRAASAARVVLPSSIQFVGGPTPGIWCRWSITNSESKPDASAVSAISDEPLEELVRAHAREVEVGDLQAEPDRCAHPRTVSIRSRAGRRSERPARLVAAAPGTDRDEGHPVRAGDRLAGGLGVEAEEGATLTGTSSSSTRQWPEPATTTLTSSWPKSASSCSTPWAPGGSSNQLIPKAWSAELAADEPHSAARACSVDVLDVLERVPHQAL